MKANKLFKAGAKLAGGAACGFGAAATFIAAGAAKLPGVSGFLYAASAGMGGTALAMGSQAISDTVSAFRDDEEQDV